MRMVVMVMAVVVAIALLDIFIPSKPYYERTLSPSIRAVKTIRNALYPGVLYGTCYVSGWECTDGYVVYALGALC